MLSHTPFLCAMYLLLFLSTVMTMMSPNWLSAWVMMEINMLSFIPMMMGTKSNQETEASIKYFLSQALGSMLMLLGMSTLYQPTYQTMPLWMIMVAMLIKLGMAPCHFWYPSVMASLSWTNCMMLSTWQKLAPLSLLMTTSYQTQSSKFMMILAGMNALIGGMLGMNQTHLRPLLAYSSIGHMGWMASMLAINKYTYCTMYFIMYSIIVMPIFIIMNTINTKTIKTIQMLFKNSTVLTFAMAILLLSLAGVPPLTGFMPKLMVMTQLMESSYTVLVFLLLGTYMNLYYYLSISFNILLSSMIMASKHKKKEPSYLPVMIMVSTSMLGMVPMIV